jgi:WD40 repeat protein
VAGRWRNGELGAVYVVEPGKEKAPLRFEQPYADSPAISPDKTLVALFASGNVVPYATRSGEAQPPLLHRDGGGGAFAMAHSPDSAKLAVAMRKERTLVVKLFDFATGKEEKQFTAPWAAETQGLTGQDHHGYLYVGARAVALTDRSVALAVIENQGPRVLLSLRIWDLATGKLRRSVLTEAEPELHVTSVALSPDNKLLAVGGYHFEKPDVYRNVGKVTVWKVED